MADSQVQIAADVQTLVLDGGQYSVTAFLQPPFRARFETVFSNSGVFDGSKADAVVFNWMGTNRFSSFIYDIISRVSGLFVQSKPNFEPRVLVVVDERFVAASRPHLNARRWLQTSGAARRTERPTGMICVLVTNNSTISDREDVYRDGVDLVLSQDDCQDVAYVSKRVFGVLWVAKANWHDQGTKAWQAFAAFVIAFIGIPVLTGATLFLGEAICRLLLGMPER